jgi:hypothetical protein
MTTAPNEYTKTDKKPIVVNGGYATPKKIWSNPYQCWLTEETSYRDEKGEYRNAKIEENLKTKKLHL